MSTDHIVKHTAVDTRGQYGEYGEGGVETVITVYTSTRLDYDDPGELAPDEPVSYAYFLWYQVKTERYWPGGRLRGTREEDGPYHRFPDPDPPSERELEHAAADLARSAAANHVAAYPTVKLTSRTVPVRPAPGDEPILVCVSAAKLESGGYHIDRREDRDVIWSGGYHIEAEMTGGTGDVEAGPGEVTSRIPTRDELDLIVAGVASDLRVMLASNLRERRSV